MLFTKTIFLTILGLGAMAFAAPVEGTTAVNATVSTATWDQLVHSMLRQQLKLTPELAVIEETDANVRIANGLEGGSARRIGRGIAGERSSTSKLYISSYALFIPLIMFSLATAASAVVTGRSSVQDLLRSDIATPYLTQNLPVTG
jgi:hypothetical protein